MPDQPDNPNTQFLERKLATILSADVAEFSRLMGEDEEQTLKTFRGHKKVFESLVAMHRGRIFNTAGDAILAEFGSAVEAVRCATDIQAALRTRNDQLPPTRQVRFRIGINLGDVMVQGQDLLGDGVNVAARLQTAAQPGGICLSGSVYDQIRNKLSLSFQSLGEKSYKNIQQPVRTFSITEADASGVIPPPKSSAARWGAARWIAVGLVPVLLAGGAYWAYRINERNKAEHAREIAAATPVVAKPIVTPSESTDVGKPETPQPPTKTGSAAPVVPKKTVVATQASVARRNESATPKTAEAPKKVAPPDSALDKAGAGAARSAAPAGTAMATPIINAGGAATRSNVPTGPYDGVYSGQVCYGQTPKEKAICYHAEGIISGGKISGKWPVGHDKSVTMFLVGHVTPSGDVKIGMHSEKADGSLLVVIDLTGKLSDGLIDARGNFRKGRPATLRWHKDSRSEH
jgi:class 3 adenylate cyclase